MKIVPVHSAPSVYFHSSYNNVQLLSIVYLSIFPCFVDHKIGHMGICVIPMMVLVNNLNNFTTSLFRNTGLIMECRTV